MDGRTFHIVKFRTMRAGAEPGVATMASKSDPRTTRVGSLLRRTSLDELPQLLNVLVGDMSLVGPRPERPIFIEEFKRQIPKYHLRHKVKAGITGWAQVNGLRGQTSIQKRIEYDLYYIENWSLMLDLKILLRTALGAFSRRTPTSPLRSRRRRERWLCASSTARVTKCRTPSVDNQPSRLSFCHTQQADVSTGASVGGSGVVLARTAAAAPVSASASRYRWLAPPVLPSIPTPRRAR